MKTKPPLAPRLREELRCLEESAKSGYLGITTIRLARMVNVSQKSVLISLRKMPDAYITAWQPSDSLNGGRPASLWRIVVPPKDCPPPPKGLVRKKQRGA
jgi:hypothetical protein